MTVIRPSLASLLRWAIAAALVTPGLAYRTASSYDDVTTIIYVYDAFGKLAAEHSSEAPTGSGGRDFRTTDHLGSTRLATHAQGRCTTWQDFYAFGERILKNASTGGTP